MLRKVRSSLHSLLLAAALPGTTLPAAVPVLFAVAASSLVVGCADENDPMTYVAQLNDGPKQTSAIKRLDQFYQFAMTNDKNDRNGPNVKPLLDKIVDPLSKLCVDDKSLKLMQDQTRSALVKLVADTQDPRGAPCLVKVLTDFKPGSTDPGAFTEQDVQQVMRAVAQTKMKETAEGVVKVFSTLKATDPKSMQDNMYKDVQSAFLATASSANEDTLIKLLGQPMPDDPKDRRANDNQAFWQANSAIALGNMKSTKAVPALLKAVLSPAKVASPIGNSALTALVKIGKPVIEPAANLLKGKDTDLVKFSTDENLKGAADIKDPKQLEAAKKAASKAYVPMAAQVLGQIGREDAIDPLLSALDGADDVTKAVIAVQLPNLPKSQKTIDAFKDVFEKTKLDTEMPGGGGAREAMLSAAQNFFDPSLIPWMLKQAGADLKGEAPDVESIRAKTLESSMWLMKPDQLADVQALYDTKGADGKAVIGKALEKEFNAVKELMGSCKVDNACYLAKMIDPKSQEKEGFAAGLKSAYMVAITGSPEIRQKLIDALPKLKGALKQMAVITIEYYSPKGDKEMADKLQALVDKADASKDQEAIQEVLPLKQVIALLNARAQ